MLELGAETARKRLPELLDRAYAGEQTIVKKRGIPYAAIVALDQRIVTTKEGLLSLRSTGKGLWGKNSNRKIDQYRDEWE
ncbi:MAG: Prevent-host-death protein [Pseudomonadota bacterium]|nr:Prevent-host-death protein [Pseudomonadota bacterium]